MNASRGQALSCDDHFWNVAFQVTSRGLTTPPLTPGYCTLTITFDFVAHLLRAPVPGWRPGSRLAQAPDGGRLLCNVMQALHRVGIDARIWTIPVKAPDSIRFVADTCTGPTIRPRRSSGHGTASSWSDGKMAVCDDLGEKKLCDPVQVHLRRAVWSGCRRALHREAASEHT